MKFQSNIVKSAVTIFFYCTVTTGNKPALVPKYVVPLYMVSQSLGPKQALVPIIDEIRDIPCVNNERVTLPKK